MIEFASFLSAWNSYLIIRRIHWHT